MQLIDVWKLNMKYLLEAKIFHCPDDLSLCLLSLPYYKWNVGRMDILNNLPLCYCSTEILQEFQIPFFACLGSVHDIHMEECAQGGVQKNMHSPASPHEHRASVQTLLLHPSLLKTSWEHPHRREEAWHQGAIGSALHCFTTHQDEKEFSNSAWNRLGLYMPHPSCLSLFLRTATVLFWRLNW